MAEESGQITEIEEELERDFLYNSDEIKRHAESDMDFFGALVCPDDMTLAFPDFHVAVWQTIIKSLRSAKDFTKYALGFPRGHGKTMVVKLMVVYAILFTQKKYILVIGANSSKAEAIISDVCDMLDSPNIQTLFGTWRYAMSVNRQDKKIFSFQKRKIILEAAGQGTSIRGSNQGNARPDFMIFDDAQTQECNNSLTDAATYRNWFLGTALKAKSPKGCTFIYIGNMYKDIEAVPGSGVYNCMLRNLKGSKGWISFVVGAILENGEALWEDLHPIEALLDEYNQDLELGQPEIFFAEVLNDPKAQTSLYVDLKKVVKKVNFAEDIHQGNYICIDPATSKQTPDKLIIGYFELYDGVPNYRECHEGKWTGPQTVHYAIKLALEKNCSLIAVEDTAYQYTLCEWFDFVLEQMGIEGIAVVPLSNKGKSKNARILDYFKALQAQEATTSPHSHAKVISQAAAFDPLVTNNLDDILDCGEMGLRVPKEFAHQIAVPGQVLELDLDLGPDQTSEPPPLPF